MLKNITNGIAHLTVTREGLVSLWDSALQAQMIAFERYIPLQLTLDQLEQLKGATDVEHTD